MKKHDGILLFFIGTLLITGCSKNKTIDTNNVYRGKTVDNYDKDLTQYCKQIIYYDSLKLPRQIIYLFNDTIALKQGLSNVTVYISKLSIDSIMYNIDSASSVYPILKKFTDYYYVSRNNVGVSSVNDMFNVDSITANEDILPDAIKKQIILSLPNNVIGNRVYVKDMRISFMGDSIINQTGIIVRKDETGVRDESLTYGGAVLNSVIKNATTLAYDKNTVALTGFNNITYQCFNYTYKNDNNIYSVSNCTAYPSPQYAANTQIEKVIFEVCNRRNGRAAVKRIFYNKAFLADSGYSVKDIYYQFRNEEDFRLFIVYITNTSYKAMDYLSSQNCFTYMCCDYVEGYYLPNYFKKGWRPAYVAFGLKIPGEMIYDEKKWRREIADYTYILGK